MNLIKTELKVLLVIMIIASFIIVPASAYARRLYPKVAPVVPVATLRLAVPYHHQEHALSCEDAGLRMLLLNRGVDEPESAILDKTPFGPMGSDPDKVFVGDVNGRQFVTGYGIHPDGLLPIANSYFPAEAFHHKDLNFLIDRLHDGNPVEIWGSNVRNPHDYLWETPEGILVHAVAGEHAMVVTGYAGPRTAPTHIFVSDPIAGEKVFQTSTFLDVWDEYDNSGLFFK